MAHTTLFPRLGAIAFRFVLWTAAIASIGSSAYLGFTYAAQSSLAFAIAAVAAEVFKPVCIQLGLDFLGSWRTCIKAPMFLAFGIFLSGYSMLAELGLSSMTRGDLVASRGSQHDAAQAAKGDRQRLVDELSTLKPSRPLAELEPLVRGAREHCVVHVSFQGRNTVCSKDGKLMAEYGRAQRRADLEAKLDKAPRLPQLAVASADSLADTLALLISDTTDRKVNVENLSKRLPLAVMLLIEVVSTFGVVIARNGGELFGGVVEAKFKPQNRSDDRSTVQKRSFLNGFAGRPQGSAARYAAERDLMAFIAQHGHTPSQEFLRIRWGTSKATVSSWLGDFEKRGLVQRRMDGRVKMASAGKRSGKRTVQENERCMS